MRINFFNEINALKKTNLEISYLHACQLSIRAEINNKMIAIKKR